MRKLAIVLNVVAALAALYVAKLLVVDVALADRRIHGAGWGEVMPSVAIGLGLVALPGGLGMALAVRGRSRLALVVAVVALVAAGFGFVVLASAAQ